MPPLQPDYRNLPNEVLRMIFLALTGTHPRRPEALYNLFFVSRRANAIAKPLFYRHVAPHLPHLCKLTAFYIGIEEWPVPKLMLLPNPAKLTSLTLNIVDDYPAFLAFLRACPFLEYLAIDMVHDKNGETPEVIPQDVIPCLRGVYCDSDFLYFCVLAGRRIEHINLVGCDISLTIHNGADLDALSEPMALARLLSVDGRMDLQCTLREDVIAPYSHLEFLAVAICDKITIGDVQMMAERWSKKLRYIYLQCSGCIPSHDATAEAFFAAMPSLGILDIEIERKSGSNSASPRWSRYFRGSPMEKDTAIDFGFPSCDDFQDPLWVDNVEDLCE